MSNGWIHDKLYGEPWESLPEPPYWGLVGEMRERDTLYIPPILCVYIYIYIYVHIYIYTL